MAKPGVAAARVRLSARRRRLATASAAVCLVAIVLTAAASSYSECRRFAYAVARLALIEMLPFWDWTQWSLDDCLLRIPLTDEGGMGEDDCKKCANVTSYHYLHGVTKVHFSSYLLRDMPAVVTDGSLGWPALQLFDEKFLLKIFEQNDKLAKAKLVSCHASSNVIRNSANVKYILKRVVGGKLDSWFAFWENCNVEAARMIRRYYERPYFIPLATELQRTNWLFATKNFTHPGEVPIAVSGQMIWFAQIRGEVVIRLYPRLPCDETCKTLHVALKTGEILVYTDLWEAAFQPPPSHELTLSLATGGTFS